MLWCCLGSGPGHTAYDARELSLAGPRESGWSMLLSLSELRGWHDEVVSRDWRRINLYHKEKITT